jgi:hemerythrin-like domain-containing protein
MQPATQNLCADHALTAVALRALSSIAAHVRGGGAFPAADGAILLRYLRDFVVGVHFRKEGELLGPAMAMHGTDETAALVGELMRLQDDAAELVLSLVMFWEPDSELTPAEQQGFAQTVDLLGQRLLRVQQLEEERLFELCEREVPLDDRLGWTADFARLERERGSADDWRTRVVEVAGRWSTGPDR